MKYLFPIVFLCFAVFFAFAIVKYGPSVINQTNTLSGQAMNSKPVARFIDFIFFR